MPRELSEGIPATLARPPVKRACFAADRTGRVILDTLWEQCLQRDIKFFNEYHVLSLIVEDGRCCGVIAYELATGKLHTFNSKAVLLATGGAGKIFKTTSNAFASTGDGMALAYRAGAPLEDMEFVQFHPTGIYKLGILISEAARGEGGILRNSDGERFMERYAPVIKDLAPRDMVSRCILEEVRAGKGIDGKDYVHLDMTHLGEEVINTKLAEITGFARTYAGVDATKEPIPVQPTCHYMMGGIATDVDGRVVLDADGTPFEGLYAAGECACVSVHGANRLGCNSLLDTLVFGRRSGIEIRRFVQTADMPQGFPGPCPKRGRPDLGFDEPGWDGKNRQCHGPDAGSHDGQGLGFPLGSGLDRSPGRNQRITEMLTGIYPCRIKAAVLTGICWMPSNWVTCWTWRRLLPWEPCIARKAAGLTAGKIFRIATMRNFWFIPWCAIRTMFLRFLRKALQ